MKRLTTLLAIGALAILSSCGKQEAPRLEDFTTGRAEVSGNGLGSYPVLLMDLDIPLDGQVDAIKVQDKSDHFQYVASGYEERAKKFGYITSNTGVMTPEIRADASKAMQGVQGLGYNESKDRYDKATQNKGK